MTPPRRKAAFYVAGVLGAAAAGFASRWVVPAVVPAVVRDAPAAQVAQASPASSAASEVAELRKSIDLLNTRLDDFNRRLSWLEGATSGALRPPPVQGSGVGR